MSVRLGRPAGDEPVGSERERGSAVAEFVMVGVLTIVLFMAAIQLGFALHVRNTLIAHASEGARYGARADSSPGQGAQRTRQLISTSLSGRFARDVSAARVTEGGATVIRVRVRAPLPLLGPFGPSRELTVSGRAFAEDQ